MEKPTEQEKEVPQQEASQNATEESSQKIDHEVHLQMQLPPALNLIQTTFLFYMNSFSKIFPILTIMYLVSAGALFLSFSANHGLGQVAALVGAFISAVANIALIRAVSGIQQPADDLIGNFHASVKLFFPYFWISILVALSVIGGTVLLFIPGLVLFLFTLLSTFVLIIEDKRGIAALTMSWKYIAKRPWDVAGKMIVFGLFMLIVLAIATIVLSIFGVQIQDMNSQVSLGAGLIQQFIQAFFFVPFHIIFMFILYTALRVTFDPAVEYKEQRFKKVIITTSIIGLIVIPFVIALVTVNVLKLIG